MFKMDIYPSVKCIEKGNHNVYRRILRDSLLYSKDAPYIKDAKDFMNRETPGDPGQFLIVCRSRPIAIKTAKYMCDNYFTEQYPEDDFDNWEYELEYDVDEDGEDLNALDLFDLSVIKETEIVPVNNYLDSLLSESDCDNAMYEGLNDGKDIRNKVDAILTDYRPKKFIWIEPERLKDDWVIDLQISKGFQTVIINDVPDSYYERICNKILATTGATLYKGLTASLIINRVKKLRGKRFAEDDLDFMIDHAVKAASERKSSTLNLNDFTLNGTIEESAEDRLNKMPGLLNVKEMVAEFTSLLLESMRNGKLRGMHSSMIFYGNPGTGKTTCANLLSEIMAEKGVSNTSFTCASRANIIGKYVGHTAVKVSELFDRARGGILFVDEAGFFLNESSGGFVQEAIKEFVRFMELYPDVTVIFAMYEREAEDFMHLDEGISSRISRMVAFEDFSDTELKDIFIHILKEKGYTPAKAAIEPAMEHILSLKRKPDFGNARDVRKLAESAIIAHSVRIHQKNTAGSKTAPDTISIADVKRGIERISKSPGTPKRRIGFEYSKAPVLPLH